MPGQTHHRVLLVGDTPLMRRSLSRKLVAAGCRVRQAADGLEAIGQLRDDPSDLIIFDIGMSRMSAVEFLTVVQRRFPQIAVIAIGCEVAAHGKPEGVVADAYLQIDEYPHAGLLKSLANLVRGVPHRATQIKIDRPPLCGAWDDNGHYLVQCPDCLRSTMVTHGHSSEHLTTCIHCGAVIESLIAEGDCRRGKG